MELRDYLKVYWSQRWMILLFIVVGVGATILVASTRPVRTGVSISFAINRTNREDTTQYQYDGYYALQASDLFSQTVVSWFSTPSVLQEVYQKANLDPEIQSVNSLPSRFSVRKYSAQNIVVRYTEDNQDRAQKVATSLATVMASNAADLNKTSDGKSLFDIVGATPVIAPSKPSLPLYAAVAAVLSLLLGLFTAAVRRYMK